MHVPIFSNKIAPSGGGHTSYVIVFLCHSKEDVLKSNTKMGQSMVKRTRKVVCFATCDTFFIYTKNSSMIDRDKKSELNIISFKGAM